MNDTVGGNPIIAALALVVTSLLTTIVIITVITTAAESSSSDLSRLVFASLLVTGITSSIQACRGNRIGTGHILVVSAAGIYIAVSVQALEEGGIGLLSLLIVSSALFQWFLSGKLNLLRHIMTPNVTGTLLMLVSISVVSTTLPLFEGGSNTNSGVGLIVSAIATILIILGLRFFAPNAMQPWTLALGIIAGTLVGAGFGLYDSTALGDAPWIGAPIPEWSDLHLQFGSSFWSLLPGFLLAATIASLRTISVTIDVIRQSHGNLKAVDFRLIQNAVTTEAAGNLFTGLLSGLPAMVMLANVSFIRVTRISSPVAGVTAGLVLVALAWLPKVQTLIIAIPKSVLGVCILLAMILLFLVGLRMILRDGVDLHSGMMIGLALLAGIAVESNLFGSGSIERFSNGALNAMTIGGVFVIVLTWVMNLTYSRAQRFKMELDTMEVPKLHEFLRDFTHRYGWSDEMSYRMQSIGEEALITLKSSEDLSSEEDFHQLRVLARRIRKGAKLEFVSVTGQASNLEDQMVLLGHQVNPDTLAQEIPLRILRKLAASVHHQQFHGGDVLTLEIHSRQKT